MSSVFLVILEEGEYSSKDWSVEAACSSKERALTHACEIAASEFERSRLTIGQFYLPLWIQEWKIDGPKVEDSFTISDEVDAYLRRHYPGIVKDRDEAAKARERLLQAEREKNKIKSDRENERVCIWQKHMNGESTNEQYHEEIAKLHKKWDELLIAKNSGW